MAGATCTTSVLLGEGETDIFNRYNTVSEVRDPGEKLMGGPPGQLLLQSSGGHVYGESAWHGQREQYQEDGCRAIHQVPFLQGFHWPPMTDGAAAPRRAVFWFAAGNVH